MGTDQPSPPGVAAQSVHRSGYVALVGRPNVGKSTLLNQVLGLKVAAVTPKPQTTRRQLLGIKTLPGAQILMVDTPGLHEPHGLLNRRMVERARHVSDEADVLVWLVDASEGVQAADRTIADGIRPLAKPIVVAVNKIDRRSKNELLPVLEELAALLPRAEIVPVSAATGENVERLITLVATLLPEGPPFYDAGEITTEPERAIAAEIIREKVILETRDEVPYAVAVTIDTFEEKPEKNLTVIKATIHVERESQKPIVIGSRGQRIKAMGQEARNEIEALLGQRVFLELFVRVQPDWTKHAARLREFGL